MPVPFLFDRGVSFRGDLSYFDLQQKLTTDDIMIKDYLGIGEQAAFIVQQLEFNVEQINENEFYIDYNFQYLHGVPDYSPEFNESSAYSKGDYVTLNNYSDGELLSGNEYAAIKDVAAGSFNFNDWREVSTTSNYELINYNFDYLNGQEKAADYNESTPYSLYDVVTYLDNAYVCTEATTGPFNPLAWQLIGVSVTGARLERFINVAINAFQFSAYGGIYLDSPPFAFPDIDGTYQTLDCFDTVSFVTPRNITQDVLTSSLAFEDLGVYEISISLVFSHNESNAGRTIYLQGSGAPSGTIIPIFIARNQPSTNFSYSFPIEVSDPSDLNVPVSLLIGGGDSLASVSFETAEYYVKSIGEYRTAFPQTD